MKFLRKSFLQKTSDQTFSFTKCAKKKTKKKRESQKPWKRLQQGINISACYQLCFLNYFCRVSNCCGQRCEALGLTRNVKTCQLAASAALRLSRWTANSWGVMSSKLFCFNVLFWHFFWRGGRVYFYEKDFKTLIHLREGRCFV